MKKSKLTLGIVTALTAVMGLTACNEVTAKEGVVLTFTDGYGNRVDYTAADLLGTYNRGSSAATTDFSKINEVLIRKYFESNPTKLATLRRDAQNDVDKIKKQAQTNADNNGTTYQAELKSLLDSNNAKNLTELFEAKLYSRESSAFADMYNTDDNVEQAKLGVRMEQKNGVYTISKDAQDHVIPYFDRSNEYGRGSNGYLLNAMPYDVSHILVKVGASADEHAQGVISESDSKNLGQVIEAIAGDDGEHKAHANMSPRINFGRIAKEASEDEGSAEEYGKLGLMQDTYVNEFRLGVFAYDALYNKVNATAASNPYANSAPEPNVDYGDDEQHPENILVKDAILPSADDTFGSNEDSVLDAFIARGIGRIPYGAAVALADSRVYKAPDLPTPINEGSATFYARNILFNKYFNNHSIAVIVPQRIPYNDFLDTGVGALTTDEELASILPGTTFFRGVYDANYASLPGFQSATENNLTVDGVGAPAEGERVLTNDKGQIVLAVRAGASSYQGIHFIVIDRSALNKYGEKAVYNDTTGAYDRVTLKSEAEYQEASALYPADTTTLDEYFTFRTPSEIAKEGAAVDPVTNYPTYFDAQGKPQPKNTFVNPLVEKVDRNYAEKASKIRSAITGYNPNSDTYRFQKLIEDQHIEFAENDVGRAIEQLVKNYIESKRDKSAADSRKTFDDAWKTYAEYLAYMDQARLMFSGEAAIAGGYGSLVGDQKLISETCALNYGSQDSIDGTGEWGPGGTCYDGK